MSKDLNNTYIPLLEENEKKIRERFVELKRTAEDFIKTSGFDGVVMCNERILMQVILDYFSDIERLKNFHGIERTRTEKIFAYTIGWIVRRKPLQYTCDTDLEKDIYVNERFAAFLMLNHCLCCGEEVIGVENKKELDEYIDLILYYFKYRECNPQVIELAIESFKLGTLVIKNVKPENDERSSLS